MAKDTNLSNAAAIAACDAIVDLIDGGASAGTINIRSGTQPSGADEALTGSSLVVITLNDPAFGPAADGTPGGVATADVDPALTAAAIGTGTATWFRVFDSNGNAIFDGSVGTSDADLVLDSVSITSGQDVTIDSWTFTVPEG